VEGCWTKLRIDGVPESSKGNRILTLVWGIPGGKTAWTVVWLAPRALRQPKAIYRFHMDKYGENVYSRQFSLERLRSHEDGNVPAKERHK
jgi:hypothetical protein